MPIRKVGGSTSSINGTAGSGSGTRVKRVTLGRPVSRVVQKEGSIKALGDVNLNGKRASGPEDGDVLVYHDTDEMWHAQKLLDKQEINGGQY